MTFSLPKTLAAWEHGTFSETFIEEMASISPDELPLIKLLRYGSDIVDQPSFMILGSEADEKAINIRSGVFFCSVLGGCNCADDPSPLDRHNEYGELTFSIDRLDASTSVTPIDT